MTSGIFPECDFQYLTYIKTTRICYTLHSKFIMVQDILIHINKISLEFRIAKGHEEISIIRFETENIYLMILVYSSIIKCFVKILQMEDYGNANEMFKLLHKKKRKST